MPHESNNSNTASGLIRLNSCSETEARTTLLAICGSTQWVTEMISRRPFATSDALFASADQVWFSLKAQDWLEAFSHHPRIGERNLAQAKFAATAEQSSKEQRGMASATESVRNEFAAKNVDYEQKFGHVFLICATGKSAEEMLASLHARIQNDAATELRNAAIEQSKIIQIRLRKLVET